MPAAEAFRELFVNWPNTISRRGIVITSLNEAIAFKGFMLKDDVLLLERQAPDAMGARFVMLQYASIEAVKIIDPLKANAFQPLGFEGTLSLT